VLTNATDPDGDQLSAVLITGPASGSLHLNLDGSFTYTPPAAANVSQVSFTFVTSDRHSTSANTVVQIDITQGPILPIPTPAKPIPTLSQWAVILLSMLMLVVAGWFRRRA